MPRRRLSVVVAAGALAVLALAGCRVEPGSAAFVGDTVLAKADVDRVLDQIKKDVKIEPGSEGRIRRSIAQGQVFVEVARRYATEQGYGEPTLDLETTAQEVR